MTGKGSRDRARQGYHHGNLRQALIDAAVELIAESGPEGIVAREVARRAKVSPGAPFRHFPSQKALMTAVAEQGIERLRELTEEFLLQARPHPIPGLMCFARAYIHWFIHYPVHYRVVADRPRIDFKQSDILVETTGWFRQEMSALYREAANLGFFANHDPESVHFHMRALSYGLGRMYVDQHLAEWDIDKAVAGDRLIEVMRGSLMTYTTKTKTVERLLEEL